MTGRLITPEATTLLNELRDLLELKRSLGEPSNFGDRMEVSSLEARELALLEELNQLDAQKSQAETNPLIRITIRGTNRAYSVEELAELLRQAHKEQRLQVEVQPSA